MPLEKTHLRTLWTQFLKSTFEEDMSWILRVLSSLFPKVIYPKDYRHLAYTLAHKMIHNGLFLSPILMWKYIIEFFWIIIKFIFIKIWGLCEIQVNNCEIVVKFFHISHNLTWYSEIVHKFTRLYPVCSTYELTKQFV